MKYRSQLDESDCGAACIAMIASSFNIKLNISKIREKICTDAKGTNLYGMTEGVTSFQIKGIAIKGDVNTINTEIPTPFITLINNNNIDNHYVVVKKIYKNKIEIWDPNPTVKKNIISKEEFFKVWRNILLFYKPMENSKFENHQSNFLSKFINIFIPHSKILFFSLLCSIIILFFGIATSFYFKYIFDEVIYSGAKFSLHTLSLGILFVNITQCLIGYFRSTLLAHLSFKTELQLNFSYLTHILKLPLDFFESRKSGEILSRLGDLEKIRNTLSETAISGIMDTIMIIISGPLLLNINAKLFGIAFVTVVIVSILSLLFAKIYRNYYSEVMSKNANVQSYLYESLNGIATVKAFNAEEIIDEEYEKKKNSAMKTGWKVNIFGIKQGLINSLINNISSILIFWLGCTDILGETMSFGTLITFNSLLSYFTEPLFRLINIQKSLQESLIAAERVGEVLDLSKEKDDSKNTFVSKEIKGHIVYDNVTFGYGNRKPLYNKLSLEITPHTWTAFVGPSGCGKSTFIKLLLRFYNINDGTIFLDSYDIRDYDISFLRSKIGYVPQDIFLFSGTVSDNISLHNKNSSFEEIVDAAKRAGADEFIQRLPDRYNTILGEHGVGLSGGEKQRLALARALLGNPCLIILDEATSNLDTLSEIQIHQVIKKLKSEGVSVILIAHRLTTVMHCDTIFVMEQGRIIEKGTHKELLANNGMYKEMWSEVQ